ncbi:hypothetical protein VUR80DRAFT_1146 [Thermomyces stellatus]
MPQQGPNPSRTRVRDQVKREESMQAEPPLYDLGEQALARLTDAPRERSTLFFALALIYYVKEDYRILLGRKEPASLLFLALWYVTASRAV